MNNTANPLKGPSKLALALALIWLPTGASPSAFQSQQEAAAGLEAIFEPGPLLQDRNGDGDIDFVAARLVLGQPAGDADVAAAANVAARLGFETSAMNLPLTSSCPDPVVFDQCVGGS